MYITYIHIMYYIYNATISRRTTTITLENYTLFWNFSQQRRSIRYSFFSFLFFSPKLRRQKKKKKRKKKRGGVRLLSSLETLEEGERGRGLAAGVNTLANPVVDNLRLIVSMTRTKPSPNLPSRNLLYRHAVNNTGHPATPLIFFTPASTTNNQCTQTNRSRRAKKRNLTLKLIFRFVWIFFPSRKANYYYCFGRENFDKFNSSNLYRNVCTNRPFLRF